MKVEFVIFLSKPLISAI